MFVEYIIEAQDMAERGKFVEVGRCKGGDKSFKVKNLKNKGEYKFRYANLSDVPT